MLFCTFFSSNWMSESIVCVCVQHACVMVVVRVCEEGGGANGILLAPL